MPQREPVEHDWHVSGAMAQLPTRQSPVLHPPRPIKPCCVAHPLAKVRSTSDAKARNVNCRIVSIPFRWRERGSEGVCGGRGTPPNRLQASALGFTLRGLRSNERSSPLCGGGGGPTPSSDIGPINSIVQKITRTGRSAANRVLAKAAQTSAHCGTGGQSGYWRAWPVLIGGAGCSTG